MSGSFIQYLKYFKVQHAMIYHYTVTTCTCCANPSLFAHYFYMYNAYDKTFIHMNQRLRMGLCIYIYFIFMFLTYCVTNRECIYLCFLRSIYKFSGSMILRGRQNRRKSVRECEVLFKTWKCCK